MRMVEINVFGLGKMTTGETIEQLINAENYTQVRMTISNDFVNFVKELLPSDYDYFAEKEQVYQDFIKSLKDGEESQMLY